MNKKVSFSYFIESWLVKCLLITKPLEYYNNNWKDAI